MPDSDEHYYITDLAKASFTEIWLASNRSPVALAVIGLMKLLRREVRSGMPMSLSVPDEIDVTSLPESVLNQLAEPLKEPLDSTLCLRAVSKTSSVLKDTAFFYLALIVLLFAPWFGQN